MSKRLLQLLFGVWLAASSLTVMAQNRTITGQILSNDDDAPMPGVTVTIKGTTRGTITDAMGNYSIAAPQNSILVYSSVGSVGQEVRIDNQSVINLKLVSDSRQLTEVVVTALGIQKEKKGLGFSQTQLDNKELTIARTTNLTNALSGKIAGVRIAGSSGMTGSASQIFIRGFTTLTGSNQPLFVIDGIPVDNGGGGTASQTGVSNSNRAGVDINQDDIETFTVLKGPAAAALYGSRAAGGAILITTKKGKANGPKKSTVQYTGSYNIVEPNRFPDYQNEYGRGTSLTGAGVPQPGVYQPNADQSNWGPLMQGQLVASPYSAADRTLFGLAETVPLRAYPNNVRDLFRQGSNQQHNLSFSGATEKTNYFFSYGLLNEVGFLKSNNLNRHSFNTNVNSQLTDRLTVGTNIQFIYNTSKRSQINNQLSNPLFRGWMLPRDYDLKNEPYVRPDGSQVYFNNNTDNPWWTLENNLYDDERARVIGNVNMSYKLAEGLTYSGRVGTDMWTERRYTVDAIGARGQANHAVGQVGAIGNRALYRQETSFYNNLTYNRKLTPDIEMTALLGNEVNMLNFTDQLTVGNTLLTRDFNHISNTVNYIPSFGRERRRLVGVYANVDVNYRRWAFLTLTGRNDWSSTFTKANRSYFYPSVSGSVVLTDAVPSLQNDVLSMVKFKGAWAKVGREAGPYSTDTYFATANPNDGFGPQIQFPFRGQQGRTLRDDAGNADLGPEFTRNVEFGAEFRFWKNRIGADLTYFDTRSTNVILSVPVAAASGFANRTQNVGSLESSGVEWSLNFTPIKNRDWKVDFTFNGARIRNTVLSLAPGVTNVSLGPFTTAQGRLVAGEAYGTIYANTLVRDANGALVVNPTTGLPIPTTGDLRRVGDPNPNWTGGITTNVNYKGFNLNFLIDIRRGGDVLSRVIGDLRRTGSVAETATLPRFGADGQPLRNYVVPGVKGSVGSDGVITTTGPNDIAITAQQYWSSLNNFNQPGMFIFDGSWTRLREASLSYTFQKGLLKKTPFGSLELGLNGRNLLLFTNVPHIDPEFNVGSNQNLQGIEFNTMPQSRSYGAFLRMSF